MNTESTEPKSSRPHDPMAAKMPDSESTEMTEAENTSTVPRNDSFNAEVSVHGPEGAPDEIQSGELPPAFGAVLFVSVLGALIPGVFMTLVASIRGSGSPLYGLLLPWTAIPFLLAIASAWRCRHTVWARSIAISTTLAAVFGGVIYTYGFLFYSGSSPVARLFLWVPLWQCVLLTRSTLRGFRQRPNSPVN